MFDAAGYSMFALEGCSNYAIAGFANSSVAEEMLTFLSPTLNYQAGDILSMAALDFDDESVLKVQKTVLNLSNQSQVDWDSFETSWDFKRHPLV